MVKLKSLIFEGDTSASTKAEKIIEICINNKNNNVFWKRFLEKNKSTPELKELDVYCRTYGFKDRTVFVKFAKNLAKYNIASARQMGSSKFDTSDKWQSCDGMKKATSKTDVLTDTKRFSVKNGSTTIRVLDASYKQMRALLLTTIESTSLSAKIKTELRNNVEQLSKLKKIKLSRLLTGEKLSLAQTRKVDNEEVQEAVEMFNKKIRSINKFFQKSFNDAFLNEEFRLNFVGESISGKMMFGVKSRAASANYFFSFASDFTHFRIIPMSTSNIGKISRNFKFPVVSTKSSGDYIGATFQSTQAVTENTNIINENTYSYYINGINDLTNELNTIDESFVGDMMDKIKSILFKAAQYVDEFISAVTELLKSGIENIVNFFQIEFTFNNINTDADITLNELSAELENDDNINMINEPETQLNYTGEV